MGVGLDISPEKREAMLRSLGRLFKKEIPDTPELHRIAALPRRVWEEEEVEGVGDIDELVVALTSYAKIKEGSQVLWPAQAKALQEAHDIGGLFGPISVGRGKTLITYLSPVLLEAKRPLLIVPAKLRGKTTREFVELNKHWQHHDNLVIVSYEKLSREGGTKFLKEVNPDLLIFDEVHRIKNKKAAVTRRIKNRMDDYPETKVIAMSGTITKRSLLDFAHVLRWCLPDMLQPLPIFQKELEAWAAAVDEIKKHDRRVPGNPNILQLLCNEEEKRTKNPRDGVRSAIRRRIQETPGVVAYQGEEVDTSLNVILSLVEGYNEETKELVLQMLNGEMPNGDIITDDNLPARWFAYRTLTSGFWYEWIPPPPSEWLKCRKEWRSTVRIILNKNIKGLESELLVTKAVQAGPGDVWKFSDNVYKDYENWVLVKNTYTYETKPVWVDDRMIQFVAEWIKHHEGIIWVSEVALGQKLEQELKLPYYHRMGLNDKREAIEDAKPPGCIVASVAANSEGRNLQIWNESLVISPPPTGTVWEQLLGRLHRPGQEADEVWFEVAIGCRVEWDCWKQAIKDAAYASEVEGIKKLSYATIDRQFEVLDTPKEPDDEFEYSPLWPASRVQVRF